MFALCCYYSVGFLCSCSSNNAVIDEPETINNGGRTEDNDSSVIEVEPEPLSAELRPVLTNEKKWYIKSKFSDRHWEGLNEDPYDWSYEVVGDSVCYDKQCKVLKAVSNDTVKTEIWLEENGTVYQELFRHDVLKKELFYAYSMTENDSVAFAERECYALSRGTIVCQRKLRRAMKVFTPNSPSHFDYYIEGIGPVYGASTTKHNMSIPLPACNVVRISYEIQQCYDGDELIFDISDFDPSTYKEEERFFDYEPWVEDYLAPFPQ